MERFTAAQCAKDARQTAKLVREYTLPREAVLPEFLHTTAVWGCVNIANALNALNALGSRRVSSW